MAVLFGALVAIAVAAVPGVVNGLLVSRLKVPPFIGTLGMFGVARGVAFLLAGGTTVPVQNSFFAALGNGRFYGVPWIVIITAVFVLVMHYLLSQTRFGQHNYAIGANVQAASRAGIDIKSHLLRLYILSGICAGLAGFLYAARFSAGAAQAGEPLLLDSVAAVVIGGASLFGGSGTILGTVAGAFVIAVIQYGLVFINVAPFWQFISVGIVIIISVLIDQAQRRFSGGRQSE
jgi:ribose transport system permease protein